MDSDAGWLATPSSLVQFLDHVASSGSVPSMPKPETIQLMTTPCPAFPGTSAAKYAWGWMVGAGTGGTTTAACLVHDLAGSHRERLRLGRFG